MAWLSSLALIPLAIAPCIPAAPGGDAVMPEFGPPKDGVWKPLPLFTDEFEGDKLDEEKWYPYNPGWKGRQPAWFSPANVTISDGKLHLTMRKETLPDLPEDYHTWTSAAVQSKTTVLYGYFEISAKPMRSHGSSAFWFYNVTPEIWTEIDVFEMGAAAPEHERVVHMNAHVFYTPTEKEHWAKGSDWTAPFDLADDYHVYALNWSKEKLEYLVDGQVVRSMANTHWHQPLTLNFDSETMPDWFGLPKDEELPATFSIEYVRAWQRADEAQ